MRTSSHFTARPVYYQCSWGLAMTAILSLSFTSRTFAQGRVTQAEQQLQQQQELIDAQEEKIRALSAQLDIQLRSIQFSLLDKAKQAEKLALLQDAEHGLESLDLSSESADAKRKALVEQINKIKGVVASTSKDEVNRIISETTKGIEDLKEAADQSFKRFRDQAQKDWNQIRWDKERFLKDAEQNQQLLRVGVNRLLPNLAGDLEAKSVEELVDLVGKEATADNPPRWTHMMLACFPDFYAGGQDSDLVKLATETFELEEVASASHEGFSMAIQMAMMTGNPYIMAAVAILALLSLIFGGGGGDGDGDGDGKGKHRYQEKGWGEQSDPDPDPDPVPDPVPSEIVLKSSGPWKISIGPDLKGVHASTKAEFVIPNWTAVPLLDKNGEQLKDGIGAGANDVDEIKITTSGSDVTFVRVILKASGARPKSEYEFEKRGALWVLLAPSQ